MTTANVYITFDGDCEEAFNFYKSVIGGEFPFFGRFKDMPPMEGMPSVAEDTLEKIMHVSLPIGEHSVLMGSDVGGDWGPKLEVGNNFSVSLGTESKEEADRLFNELSVGGKITMPIQSTFGGDYFGSFTDKFGINWMVSFPENPQK